MKKRWMAVISAVALSMTMLAGCAGTPAVSSSQSASTAQSAASTPDSKSTAAQSTASDTSTTQEGGTIRLAGLKGPTTMGIVSLMNQVDEGTASHDYQVEMYGTADEIAPKLIQGELDAAMIPCNLASVLYNKTQGKIQTAAINTLGVLYIVGTESDVASVADLKGKTLYATGKGTTPEYALNHILRENGLEPGVDVTIEYKSEATEVVSALAAAGEGALAMLPQPYVTTAQMQMNTLNVLLDLTEEWNKVSPDSALVTGVLVVQKDFAQENPELMSDFLADYQASVEWVNANTAEAAQLIADYGIVPKAAVAEKALPQCNITFVEGDAMKQQVSGYLQVLMQADASSVGGELPGDDFYYGA